MTARPAWLDHLLPQIASAGPPPPLAEDETRFDWAWFAGRGPRVAAAHAAGEPFSADWLASHDEPLWEVGRQLADDASRSLFSWHLVLRCVGPARAGGGWGGDSPTHHRAEHLWESPRLFLAAHPGYRLFFGHHRPLTWESGFCAVQAR